MALVLLLLLQCTSISADNAGLAAGAADGDRDDASLASELRSTASAPPDTRSAARPAFRAADCALSGKRGS